MGITSFRSNASFQETGKRRELFPSFLARARNQESSLKMALAQNEQHSDSIQEPLQSISAPWPARHPTLAIALRAVLLALAAAALFFLTSFVAQRHLRHQQELAAQWFEQAERESRAGDLDRAIMDYRTALAYSRDNRLYLLRLALALAADRRLNEARTYLLSLFEAEPGNGQLNLELARLAAEQGDMDDVLRFFHGAIYGVWQTNAALNRLEARIELVEFLLSRRDYPKARSELLATAPDLPKNAALQDRIAGFFIQSSDYGSALDLYQRSLKLNDNDTVAWRGAAVAAFKSGEYGKATKYFEELLARARYLDPEAESLYQTAEYVLQLDPYARDLSQQERYDRTLRDFAEAGRQLKQCTQEQQPSQFTSSDSVLETDLQKWSELRPRIKMLNLRHEPDLSDMALALVSDVEQDLGPCELHSPIDSALLLIFGSPSRAGMEP